MKSSGDRIVFCGNDAVMDWVCQKVCRLRIPILLPTIYVRIHSYPVTCSSLETEAGRRNSLEDETLWPVGTPKFPLKG